MRGKQQEQHHDAAGDEHRAPSPQLDEEAGKDRAEREAGVHRPDGDAEGAATPLRRHRVGNDRRMEAAANAAMPAW